MTSKGWFICAISVCSWHVELLRGVRRRGKMGRGQPANLATAFAGGPLVSSVVVLIFTEQIFDLMEQMRVRRTSLQRRPHLFEVVAAHCGIFFVPYMAFSVVLTSE